MTLLVL